MADLLDAVAGVVAEAGAMALARWRTDVGVRDKADGSPVCEVDLAVDVFLRERLAAIDPHAGWLSEETADAPDRLARQRVWVVDPIDGTRDFIRGRDGWAVSVALVEQGRVTIGVLDAPARGDIFRAALGQGATRNGVAIHAGDRRDFSGSRVPTDGLPKVDQDLVVVAKPNSIALRIAMVAADEADLVATLRWGYEWDVAAAALIAAEAGASVSDAFGVPLAFNTPRAQAFGVLATTPGIHAAAVERLRERARRLSV